MAHADSSSLNNYRPLIVTGILLATVGILIWAQRILMPIALAILLSFVLTPAVSFLQARGLRRTQAVLTVVFLTFLVLGGLLVAIAVEFRDLAVDLPTHKEHIQKKVRDLFGHGPGVFDNLTKMFEEINIELQKTDANKGHTPAITLPIEVRQDKSTGIMQIPSFAAPVMSFLGSVSLTVALTISMLFMRENLRNRFIHILGEGHLTSATRAIDETTQRISRYLIIQVSMNSAFGFLFGMGLYFIGVRYALLWGVLATVLRFIPYVGTWLAAGFAILVSLAVEGWMVPILVIGYVTFLGVLANNILEPKLVSRSTGVSPIALVLSTAFWTWLWGPIGLVLATPLTVCLSVLGKYVPSLQFLDLMLGNAPPLNPELTYYQRLLAHDEAEAADLLEQYLSEHTLEQMCDDLLVPTLWRARLDREKRLLSEEDFNFILTGTEELFAEAAEGKLLPGEENVGENAVIPDGNRPVILACPARDGSEEVALRLFVRLLGPNRAEVIFLGSGATASEVVEKVGTVKPTLFCLACMPPLSNARGRYLCKRLRSHFPQLPIVVGCWGGQPEDCPAPQILAAGATKVGASLSEVRSHVLPILQVARHIEPALTTYSERPTVVRGGTSADGDVSRRPSDESKIVS